MSKLDDTYKLLDDMVIDLNEEKKRLKRLVNVGQITNSERHNRFNSFYISRLNDVAETILETV